MAIEKTWWAPVWRGLVVDPEAKHCRRVKNAIWLYLYLILHANRQNGKLKRKLKTTARDMGISQKTIQRWLKTLKDNDYIETKNTGRCLEIGIKLWKNAAWNPKLPVQVGQRWPSRVDRREDSHPSRNWQKLLM